MHELIYADLAWSVTMFLVFAIMAMTFAVLLCVYEQERREQKAFDEWLAGYKARKAERANGGDAA